MDGDLVKIAGFTTAAEAERVRSLVEAEGIPCFLSDANLATADPWLGPSTVDIGLQVERRSAAAAAAIIESHEAEIREARRAAAREEKDGVERCLSCNAPFPEDAPACPSCGFSYTGG